METVANVDIQWTENHKERMKTHTHTHTHTEEGSDVYWGIRVMGYSTFN
jgi:hypothetical protein